MGFLSHGDVPDQSSGGYAQSSTGLEH